MPRHLESIVTAIVPLAPEHKPQKRQQLQAEPTQLQSHQQKGQRQPGAQLGKNALANTKRAIEGVGACRSQSCTRASKGTSAASAMIPGGPADEWLWDEIWSIVEGIPPGTRRQTFQTPTTSAAARAPRLAVPPSLGISTSADVSLSQGRGSRKRKFIAEDTDSTDVASRARLVGKQAPRPCSVVCTALSVAAAPKPARLIGRSFYDVLGVSSTASLPEIRAAFRAKALATHPDKGGNAAEFNNITLAFETLSDDAKRAEYDSDLSASRKGTKRGSTKTSTAGGRKSASSDLSRATAAAEHRGAARIAYQSLWAARESTWKTRLQGLNDDVFKCLLTMVSVPLVDMPLSPTHPHGVGAASVVEERLSRHSNGYTVTVTWSSLSVCTQYTRSLSEAIDWQISLTRMRSNAQARLLDASSKRIANKEPLIDAELNQLLHSEPALQLAFACSIQRDGNLIRTPTVRDLPRALEFRRRLLASRASELDMLKAWTVKEAAKDRDQYKIRLQRLAAAVAVQSASRQAMREIQAKKRKAEVAGLRALPAPPSSPSRRVRSKVAAPALAIEDTSKSGSTVEPLKSSVQKVAVKRTVDAAIATPRVRGAPRAVKPATVSVSDPLKNSSDPKRLHGPQQEMRAAPHPSITASSKPCMLGPLSASKQIAGKVTAVAASDELIRSGDVKTSRVRTETPAGLGTRAGSRLRAIAAANASTTDTQTKANANYTSSAGSFPKVNSVPKGADLKSMTQTAVSCGEVVTSQRSKQVRPANPLQPSAETAGRSVQKDGSLQPLTVHAAGESDIPKVASAAHAASHGRGLELIQILLKAKNRLAAGL
eukprot:TRINITY_DN37662_c0_g1_i1.p1 TRINITY_DN37662_c0_g1~~TRINITY_DN37662_c0_g1_i1.p1  ORF type:complete len:828 (-),score=90.68 TRINITY_DN37662_c0_g1_i1:253-2736(-)